MVNFGLNAAAILGLFLAVAGAGLFFLRSIRPELARDYDIFFAAVGLLCGIILLFNGWRLDPILQFGQFLLTGTAIFFAFESIRMRGVATEQARRNTPVVDRDRPVSRTRVYTEAELDKIDPYENAYEGAAPNYNSPRLRGYEDPQTRPPRSATERQQKPSSPKKVRDEPRRSRSRNRPESSDYVERLERPQPTESSYPERDIRPRRRPTPPPQAETYDDWDAKDEWDESPRNASRPSRRPIREVRYPTAVPKSKPNPANLADLGRSYDEPEDNYEDSDGNGNYDEQNGSIPGDYVVDYQPLEDSEPDYSNDYDQDEYDDYDDGENDNSPENYGELPRRKPINFDK